MIIAEEMDIAWRNVVVAQADFHKRYGDQFAGGSLGVRVNWEEMRKVGATVREIFRLAGANYWKTSIENCITSEGFVIHTQTSESRSYGSLIAIAKDIPLPAEAEFKKPQEYRIVGRKDIPSNPDIDRIVSGKLLYASDIKLDGMLYASVERAPFFEAQVDSVDDSEALKISGVRSVIVLNNENWGGRLLQSNSPNFVSGVAVIASNTFAAFQGRKALKISWKGNANQESSELLRGLFEEKIQSDGVLIRDDGHIVSNDSATIEATYFVPFLAHVPMEPMNCVAHYQEKACEIWAPTQNPEYIVQGISKVLSLPEEKLKIHLIRAGGAFGRRYYADFCIDAALLSKITNAPVKVTWTREDDIHYDYFRPASLHKMKAVLDYNKKKIVYWKHKMAGTSRSAYLGWQDPPHDSEMDAYTFPAGFVPNLRYEFVHVPSQVPLGQWRSVSDSANLFVIQSFLAEVALALRKDPIDFYLSLLGSRPEVPVFGNFKLNTLRLRNVVEMVKRKSNWDSIREHYTGYGFAAGYSQGSFVALTAKVQVVENRLKILNITAAVDCGLVINPSGARAQVEGCIIEGLSAALFDKIEIEASSVKQSNFHDYRWLRLSSTPQIEVHFIESTEPPRGLGEPVLPMVAPAVCNAIQNATGKNIRELPITDHGFVVV